MSHEVLVRTTASGELDQPPGPYDGEGVGILAALTGPLSTTRTTGGRRTHPGGPAEQDRTAGPDAPGPDGPARRGPAPSGGIAEQPPTRHDGRPSRALAALSAAALVIGVLVGAGAWRAWSGEQAAADAFRSGRADAVAAGPLVISPEAGRTRLSWTVVVRNPGAGRVVVRAPTPSEGVRGEPGFLRASPREAEVAPGGDVRMTVETVVPCAGRDPVRAPTLRARGVAGPERAVPVTGALALALATCADQPPAARPLLVDSLEQQGDRLALTLSSPTGRPWLVTGVRAGAVALVVEDDDREGAGTLVDDGAAALTLVVPEGTACPADWWARGVPQTLSVRLAADEPVDVSLAVGLPLSRWLLATVCGGP